MSEADEPPSKITRVEDEEMEEEFLEDEEEQEEWLSEELLTDEDNLAGDDYTMVQTSQDNSTMEELSQSVSELNRSNRSDRQATDRTDDHDSHSQQQSTVSDELDAFLIRKTDGSVLGNKKKHSEFDRFVLKSEVEYEDGNSTDDLLRMLGEDGERDKKKKMVKKPSAKAQRALSTDDDEDHFLESSDEVNTVKKMFVTKKKTTTKATPKSQNAKGAAKNQSLKVSKNLSNKNQSYKSSPKNQTVKMMNQKGVVKLPSKNQNLTSTPKILPNRTTYKESNEKNTKETFSYIKPKNQKTKNTFDPPRRIGNVTITPRSSIETKNEKNKMFNYKSDTRSSPKIVKGTVMETKKITSEPEVLKATSKSVKSNARGIKPETRSKLKLSKSAQNILKTISDDFDEIIDEEEFLEDSNNFDLNELLEESDEEKPQSKARVRQRIMKPEVMDEEVPSDAESRSEEGDVYDSSGVESAYAAASMHDEMPSSDYEDELEEWFTLDVRTERAGEYLPLLGPRAYQLLSSEKERVTSRLESLRSSAAEHRERARRHRAELRAARATLAELDAMLVAL